AEQAALLDDVESNATQATQTITRVTTHEERVDTVETTPFGRGLIVGLRGTNEHVADHRDWPRISAALVTPARFDALGLPERSILSRVGGRVDRRAGSRREQAAAELPVANESISVVLPSPREAKSLLVGRKPRMPGLPVLFRRIQVREPIVLLQTLADGLVVRLLAVLCFSSRQLGRQRAPQCAGGHVEPSAVQRASRWHADVQRAIELPDPAKQRPSHGVFAPPACAAFAW